jgi:hypothetical protein
MKLQQFRRAEVALGALDRWQARATRGSLNLWQLGRHGEYGGRWPTTRKERPTLDGADRQKGVAAQDVHPGNGVDRRRRRPANGPSERRRCRRTGPANGHSGSGEPELEQEPAPSEWKGRRWWRVSAVRSRCGRTCGGGTSRR